MSLLGDIGCNESHALLGWWKPSKKESPSASLRWGPNLLPSMTRWIAVSSGRVRAEIHPKVAPVCTPACRVVTSIYTLRLKRWRL